MDTLNIRLAEEKNFHSEVLLFSFNPEHDIIVVCSANGDVIAYQAYIRKVWALGTRNQRKKPVSLAWRPDGQVLAVIFSNRTLVLASVQDGHSLLSETLPFEIRSCNWIERTLGQQQPQPEDSQFESLSIDNYLPVLVDLPSINRSRKHLVDPPDDLFSLDKQTKLNILILFGSNDILLRAFGLWPLLLINRSSLPTDQTLLSVTMSSSLDTLCLFTRCDLSVNYSLFECTSFLSDYHNDYFHLTRSLCRIKSLILFNDKIFTTLIDLTTKCFSDFQTRINTFCETSRQQMKQWTFQCELISLLSTGNSSEYMQQNFFGNIFDYGYAKKLVTAFEETKLKSKELIVMFGRTIEHIFGYLVEIKGLLQWYGKFDQIEFDPNILEMCLSNAGSLLLKINEYTDFIHEMSDVYTFFLRWLGFVAHQLHTSKHNTSTHHDEQIECTEADWDHLIEFLDGYCSFDEPVLDIFSMYLKSENLPETLVRDSAYRKLFDHSNNNNKNAIFSPKPRRSLAGAYQDLKQSIMKAFEVRTQSSNFQMNKSLPLLASIPIDQQFSSTVEFDHRRSQHSINYILQQNPLQFHLIIYTSASKQCLVRLIDLQHILSPQRSIANFKLYDDDKLAIVCSNTTDLNNGNNPEIILFNTNHQSNLMIISFKPSIDSQAIDLQGNNTNIILSYPLKDIPAKLTVDGRRNLIAVWSKNRKLTTFIHNPSDDINQGSSSSQIPIRMDDESTLVQSGSTTTMISSQDSTR